MTITSKQSIAFNSKAVSIMGFWRSMNRVENCEISVSVIQHGSIAFGIRSTQLRRSSEVTRNE